MTEAFKKMAAFAAVMMAALFFTIASPVEAEAAESVYISSTQEGIEYISAAVASYEPEIYLVFEPGQVDVGMLIMHLRALIGTGSGIHTYNQMIYDGFDCCYSSEMLQVNIAWKLTQQQEQVFDATVQMLAPYLVGATQYDTIKNVHDWICLTTDYDYETVAGTANRHTGYNALFENRAVCDGYATLFQKFMDKLGVPCYCVAGNGHAWNVVMYNGQWYRVDCTWDDQDFGIIYNFFMY
ncbi:MAG: transglutaminase domain-containing protein [Clostridia bacterium]|nr:transglutaminase domain-containing protein [Clostridia bacterium]